MNNDNCNNNTFWSKTENGTIECNKRTDKTYIEIGIWEEGNNTYNDYAILNKQTAIGLRDFLNKAIGDINE